MRHLSSMACASVVALAAVALMVDGAIASTNLNSSKSNIYKLGPTDTDQACTDQSGIVSTAADGTKTCTTPPTACATPVSYGSPNTERRIDTNDVAAVTACFDACGKIAPGKDGYKICSAPQAVPGSTGDPHAIEPGPDHRRVTSPSRSSLPH